MMVILQATNNLIFPADRCTWQQQDGPGGVGYAIGQATFYPGHGAASDYVAISSPRLGFIGKSGRFVEIAS